MLSFFKDSGYECPRLNFKSTISLYSPVWSRFANKTASWDISYVVNAFKLHFRIFSLTCPNYRSGTRPVLIEITCNASLYCDLILLYTFLCKSFVQMFSSLNLRISRILRIQVWHHFLSYVNMLHECQTSLRDTTSLSGRGNSYKCFHSKSLPSLFMRGDFTHLNNHYFLFHFLFKQGSPLSIIGDLHFCNE